MFLQPHERVLELGREPDDVAPVAAGRVFEALGVDPDYRMWPEQYASAADRRSPERRSAGAKARRRNVESRSRPGSRRAGTARQTPVPEDRRAADLAAIAAAVERADLTVMEKLLGILSQPFYEGCQVLFLFFLGLAVPLDKPHLLLMSTQDSIYPFMP